ncbi:YdbH family protein [Brenneria izadpanahii]|uniref:YdbH family protein n=1 Tax=Brenneria izadpanahii TaxID=2722756 RepID=A0ABX7UZP1_9GAMM|nr:YdbH family protein [Brenneria izadpanahii]QTF10780.1 YdbH family protein [Brenneria izadpanahii]
MTKKYSLAGLALILLLLVVSWRTLPQWLPRLIGIWLPAEMSFTLDSSPVWHDGGLRSQGFSLQAGDCQLLDVRNISLHRQSGRWRVAMASVTLDSDCLSRLPSDDNAAPVSLSQWQRRLPAADITIETFELKPWRDYTGQVRLSADGNTRQTLDYQSEALSFQAQLSDRHLVLRDGVLATPADYARLRFGGEMELADTLAQPPVEGMLQGQLDTGQTPESVSALLRWQGRQGSLSLNAAGEAEPLAVLPWLLTPETVQIKDGLWRWPYAVQPLSGQLSVTLQHWRQGLDKTRIDARMNMLTQGHNGKANVVLVLGPGNLGLINSQLRFQLTGQANLSNISLTASLPGMIQGSVLNPELSILPGALLRAWGMLSPQVRLEEARWPLAGVRVGPDGINGRLQAIVKAQDEYWGRFNLHLDGQAQDFWPDKGQWQWRYWGRGQLPPLKARWDVAGRGSWQDTLIEVRQLSSGLDQLSYGLVTAHQPRLTIEEPIRWQRTQSDAYFQGALQLATEQVDFSNGGYLPPSLISFKLNGRDPNEFLWQGRLQARDIGPVTLRGRWDGERLRGGAWWPQQPLTVFQPLLSPRLKMNIRSGQFYAQSAFSAARGEGFRAGGHWVVKNGDLWLQDGGVRGVNFILPYRLQDQHWQLGVKQPVTLRIDTLDNLFRMTDIRVDLQGFYPYSEGQPLTMSQASMDVLGGHIALSALRLPQHDDALLKVESIELSELLTALKQKQIAMSGKVSGVLPLNFSHPKMLIQKGRITNDNFLTLRLDQQLAEELASKNIATGAAIGWLRYLEIGRSYAAVELDNQGALSLNSQIQGKNPTLSADRQVTLNYRHQENIFQLWRSLRFGDNLQDTLEQQANE